MSQFRPMTPPVAQYSPPTSPKRTRRLADCQVDKQQVWINKTHVANETLFMIFKSTSNLVQSWFAEDEDEQLTAGDQQPRRSPL
jgi:hypothetical protein